MQAWLYQQKNPSCRLSSFGLTLLSSYHCVLGSTKCHSHMIASLKQKICNHKKRGKNVKKIQPGHPPATDTYTVPDFLAHKVPNSIVTAPGLFARELSPPFPAGVKTSKRKVPILPCFNLQNLITLEAVGAAKSGQFNGESSGIGTRADKSVGK